MGHAHAAVVGIVGYAVLLAAVAIGFALTAADRPRRRRGAWREGPLVRGGVNDPPTIARPARPPRGQGRR